MRKADRLVMWCLLLQKRLFKKPAFWLILLSVLLVAEGTEKMTGLEKGILTILIFEEEPGSVLSKDALERLRQKNPMLSIREVNDREAAIKAVEKGDVDCVWIFPAFDGDWKEEVVSSNRAAVTVVEREDTVYLQLARERLFGLLYPELAGTLYRQFVLQRLDENVRNEVLEENYRKSLVREEIFQSLTLGEKPGTREGEETDYLLMPVRGMLILLVMLCGFAASLYRMQDEEKGTFAGMEEERRNLVGATGSILAMADVSAVVLAAFFLSDVAVSLGREILLMILYLGMVLGYCSFIRHLCKTIHRLGVCVPILMMAAFVLCPIFFSVRAPLLQLLFPPYYYLQAIEQDVWIYGMVLYIGAGILLSGICRILKRRCKNAGKGIPVEGNVPR